MHSVRIELAKLILAGTRITYQATGDADMHTKIRMNNIYISRHANMQTGVDANVSSNVSFSQKDLRV